ncbi:unnamed protein product [Moneuplotes crassus]|uniref:GTP-binding protein n=1 Tax=Euplotes crassus TaxID=5936 RepID=A0A7S3NZ14_EUPCR|nr:unnamed protein product [Moneuplotes crassus]CAI2376125.1 unnamed protein product [Moneuplotes crassus]|mmetsp:Transcript_8695/g.8222  ORF Transcript_8695/g.8222 Transcript_8695/m.8222 type:complete len:311 (+) Transcript_8695:12-944(+)
MATQDSEKVQKVLLMGRAGSGKTSMRSIIFANYLARDTYRFTFTVDINRSRVRFLGNLVLSLWDCGGQGLFMEQYFQSQKDQIFKNVEVLIYVFEVVSKEPDKDLEYYKNCLAALEDLSQGAKIFCMIHKMDLIADSMRDKVFEQKQQEIIDVSKDFDVTCFRTSIWDETLYKAWSDIVNILLPNVQDLKSSLKDFCDANSADDVVLFEKYTFLVIANHDNIGHKDDHRFEKISNIIKQFKLSCIKTNFQFESMTFKNSYFTAFVEEFTSSTYIMVISSDPDVETEAISFNIKASRDYFENLVTDSLGSS